MDWSQAGWMTAGWIVPALFAGFLAYRYGQALDAQKMIMGLFWPAVVSSICFGAILYELFGLSQDWSMALGLIHLVVVVIACLCITSQSIPRDGGGESNRPM